MKTLNFSGSLVVDNDQSEEPIKNAIAQALAPFVIEGEKPKVYLGDSSPPPQGTDPGGPH